MLLKKEADRTLSHLPIDIFSLFLNTVALTVEYTLTSKLPAFISNFTFVQHCLFKDSKLILKLSLTKLYISSQPW